MIFELILNKELMMINHDKNVLINLNGHPMKVKLTARYHQATSKLSPSGVQAKPYMLRFYTNITKLKGKRRYSYNCLTGLHQFGMMTLVPGKTLGGPTSQTHDELQWTESPVSHGMNI